MHTELTKFKPGYFPFYSSAAKPTREIPKQSSETWDVMASTCSPKPVNTIDTFLYVF